MLISTQLSIMIYAEPGLLRDSITSLLTSFGLVRVMGTLSGASPDLDQVRQLRPDLILVDFSSQPAFGEFLAAVRTVHPEIQCIAIVESLSQRDQALKQGVDITLTKGFTSRDLRLVIRDALQHLRPGSPGEGGSVSTVCVLVADDDPLNLTAMRVQLEYLGYRVETAKNGHEVLAALGRKDYRLLLMDMYMGDTDGLTTTQEIRAVLPAAKQPYIAILTGGVTKAELAALFQAGIDEYIEKPVMLDKLKTLLEHACQGNRPPVSAALLGQEASGPVEALPESFDFQVLDELLRMNRQRPGEKSANFLDMFYESMPGLMHEIRKAAHQGSSQELMRLLHAFRSSSDIYGASRLALLCKQLEREIAQDRFHNISVQIDTIEAEFIKVARLLRSYPPGGAPPAEPGAGL